MGMQYRTSSMDADEFYTFWVEKNLQGDIVAVYNSAGTKVVSYAFGYVGAVLFPETILCMAAGANQIKNHKFKYGSIFTFFDDERDNQMIKYGYNLYRKDNYK